MRNTYCVYQLISPEGKSYIGMTIYGEDANKRWKNGAGYRGCKRINDAIKKYGWESFEKRIIENGLTRKEASETEKYWVNQLKTTDQKYGYNDNSGGLEGFTHSEECKEKISKSHIGIKPNDETRRKLSEIARNRPPVSDETRKKLSIASKGRKLNLSDEEREARRKRAKERKYSEDTISALRKAAIGNTYRRTPIRCVETGEVFESQYAASQAMGFVKGAIASALHQGCKCGGYHWEKVDKKTLLTE